MIVECPTQVNLGILEENPTTTALVIKIMEHHQKYIPKDPIGNAIKVPVHGVAMPVERMIQGIRARAADLGDTLRLVGIFPVPQEFHHRGLMLQV